MYMKRIFLMLVIAGSFVAVMAQQVDTTYYDKNWRGVKFKQLAQYIRYDFRFNDPSYEDIARIFYLGGQLEAEGTPLSCNKFDGNKSVWKKELSRYYPNGNKKEIALFNEAGQLQGKLKRWAESGQLILDEEYQQGIRSGISLEYPIDKPDVCYATKFINGVPENNETTIFYKSGKSIIVDYTTKQIRKSTPGLTDCKKTFKDGITSWFYDMNGIYLSLNFSKTNLYGKFYQCFLVFSNNTDYPIEVNPENISGEYKKGDKKRPIELMPAEQYLKIIARNQAFSLALAGFASGLSTYNAGYTTSTTRGTVVGAGGWATGTATTTTFNPYERQAILNNEQAKLNDQAKADKELKDAIDGSVLKRTVVNGGEQIVKSFYVKYLSADHLDVSILIDGMSYKFEMSKF